MFFELRGIPIAYIILKWGYQPERIQATIYLILYMIFSSLPFLFFILKHEINDIKYLGSISVLKALCFSLPFLVKLPMWGLHLWLPKAHVQAPLRGSMFLAGILLKLGGYGLIVFIPKIEKIFLFSG
jgi:NADH-ubiquinone oxidoreductase chain 4